MRSVLKNRPITLAMYGCGPHIAIALDFDRPFQSHGNVAEFTLAPHGNATDVTWSMRGPQPYMAKVMGLFFNTDRMVGGDFEQGLGNLKRIAEG